MNKIHNINLGGYPFSIDEDVYQNLNSYLNTIENHFGNSEGVCDIMTDIEARMAELFTESLGERKIVNQDDLKNVINIMGTPEQFGAESGNHHSSENRRSNNQAIQTGKRFFRDPDNKVIGGVCSGIAAYWGIEDPIWVRLVFGFLLLSGIGPIPYIVLWIVVPSAKTTGDRLAMRGENANVENIGRMIEDEFSEMSDSISKITDDYFTKKKSNPRSRNILKRTSDWIGFAFNAGFRVLQTCFNIILSIFGLKKT